MRLGALQQSFIGHVLAEDAPVPSGWEDARLQAGLAIYRNGYRARMIEALGEVFPRTRQWVGGESFERAAAHHLILHPPAHWSLDRAGEGFAATLTTLFHNDPEVPELALLEWDMHLAFVAADKTAIDAAGFVAATSDFGEQDWTQVRLALSPSLTVRPVKSRVVAIWRSLAEAQGPPAELFLESLARLVVWREGTRPVFRIATALEGRCLEQVGRGVSFGDLCASLAENRPGAEAAAEAGAMLGRWLRDGLIVGLR